MCHHPTHDDHDTEPLDWVVTSPPPDLASYPELMRRAAAHMLGVAPPTYWFEPAGSRDLIAAAAASFAADGGLLTTLEWEQALDFLLRLGALEPWTVDVPDGPPQTVGYTRNVRYALVEERV